jgi:hypothetical protein
MRAAGRTVTTHELIEEITALKGASEMLKGTPAVPIYVRVASPETPGTDALEYAGVREDQIVLAIEGVELRSDQIVLDVSGQLEEHLIAFARLKAFVEEVGEKRTKGRSTALAENALELLSQLGME